ncbi:NAD(P)H-dependent oxidoreductase [Streptomyces sp. DSM 44917]|uniref:NAD(P)H-dependent oxidoreductase n=1 Tax=Streptomyces boetiae TaxID=3075541 RepID=A0ABU2L9E6_9ACTN|nr:NAD(P)H-dependent oxidoreductase [Streptomyces sp. DSM 44917]MDT0307903.1 NAD(P)H-dependent oxidoreductase [Streptomyces sp. DSM 44917]
MSAQTQASVQAPAPAPAAGPARPLRLAVILGSVRDGRFGPVVAEWFAGRAREHGGLDVRLIDTAEHPLPVGFGPGAGEADEPGGPGGATPRASVAAQLAQAEAFVVVTPEYNHSIPASLKNLIDWHNVEWHAKPVGFVSYGGISGGLRAVEHLRHIFAELHTVTIRDTVSFHMAWERFDREGRPVDPKGPNDAATALLNQLSWWAHALREARADRPYGA